MSKTIKAEEIIEVKRVEFIDEENGFMCEAKVKPSKILDLIGDNKSEYPSEIIANNLSRATIKTFSRVCKDTVFIDFGSYHDFLPVKIDNNASVEIIAAVAYDMLAH